MQNLVERVWLRRFTAKLEIIGGGKKEVKIHHV